MNQSIASFYGHLGEAYFNHGEPNRAIECYQACFPILETLDEPAVAAGIHLGLAIIYEKLGWAEDELRAHKEALKFIEKAPYSESLGFYQRWVADSYAKLDQYDTALNYYILSLSTFAQQNNFEEMISVHGKIALSYSRLAVPEKVKEHIEIAVSLLDQIKDLEKKEEATAYIRWLLSPKE